MLKVTNIQKSFNGHHVLKGIDFEINKGEVVAILGPSGSGKTTFLRCLNLLERPEKGVLAFTDGNLTIDFSKKISKADELKLRRCEWHAVRTCLQAALFARSAPVL